MTRSMMVSSGVVWRIFAMSVSLLPVRYFKQDSLKYLTGKRLTDIAKMRHTTPEETIIDLVIADHSRVEVIYFLMSEDNVKKEISLPYMAFGSDEASMAPEGVFLRSSCHPRAYGNFARLLGHYVRDEKLIPLEK